MKAALRRFIFLLPVLYLLSTGTAQANGCTGSWFTMTYSPWCDCWQVCGNYISDCDEVVSINWNFGDGTTASGENPCHQFPGPGTYTVTMTIVAYCHNSFFNLFTTTCHITQQVVVPAVNVPLVANFVADTSCFGSTTHFTNTTTSPGGNNIYTWIFPDGSTSSATNPTYTFDSCGAYDVMLIVQNQSPCCNYLGDDTVVHRVYVDCTPFAFSNELGDNEPYIHESFATVSVTSGSCAGDTTRFLIVPDGPIVNWVWTFPDSSISFYEDPWYIYDACPPAINYTTVTIFTNRGCVAYIDSLTGIFCPSNIGLSSTQTLCTGQCSGTATTTLSGGTPPYTVQWNDPNNQTSNTAINLCPGNYNVTITDGNGCTATPNQPVAVDDFPFPLGANALITGNVRCYGWAGGSALLTYTGGTPPYSVFWSNGATTDTVSGLIGGTHNITVTDAHGCTLVSQVNIPQPPEVLGPVTTVNATCNLCNGSATVNATGGNGVYNYYWTNSAQNVPTVNGICAGVYTVITEDANVTGCSDTVSFAINENGAQPISSSSTDATCYNLCNGTGTVTLTGGCLDPPCNFAWLDSTGNPIGQSTAVATNLCSGNYVVNVTNGSGCNSFASLAVHVPNPVVVTAISTINTCGANCNGTITATASSGQPPYSYQWLDSNSAVIPGQTNSTITNVCAGTYFIRVTDAQGCIATEPVPVYQNPFVANATGNSVLCNGDCSGIITVLASAGAAPYTYAVQNGATSVYTGSSFITANLCAGNYTVIATDAANCPVTIPVNIGQPPAINPVPGTIEPTCFGACNGTVLVNVTGGTAPYMYEWRNGQGVLIGSGTTVNNLCAGSYAVQIRDTNNCVTPFIGVTLGQPSALNDSMRVIDPYCDGGQGSIDLTPYGGTAPYTFSWNNGAYTTEDVSGLSSGTFAVQITDANNCVKRDTVTFTLLPLLTVQVRAHSYNGYNFKCYNGNDGEVVVDVVGGLPPYTYQWDDSLLSTVDSIYGLVAGLYHVTVTDANGCEKVDSVNLNLMPPPYSLSETHQDILCAGDTSGSITVTPVGGVPPYLAYWRHDNNLNATQITNIDTGEYVIYVFDSVFCLRIDTIQIDGAIPLLISHVSTDALCPGAANGSVDLTISGGAPPYMFDWNSGAYVTEDISALPAGLYTVLATDSNGCGIADTATINDPPAITATLTAADATCFGVANGSVDLTTTNAIAPVNYDWNNGTYTTEDLLNVGAGTYTVLLTDNNNCTGTGSATINEPAFITGSRQVTICATDSVFAGGNYQNTTGLFFDTLTAANGCDSLLATDLTVIDKVFGQAEAAVCYGRSVLYNGNTYSASGVYIDTLMSEAGCDSIVTFTLTVMPDMDISATPNTAKLNIGDSITISMVANSSSGSVSYSWYPAEGLSCADCAVPVVLPEFDTRYTVIGIDTSGCADTTVVPIFVNPPVLFIPNVFTPNSDGANDFFEIFGNLAYLRQLEVNIFDRWGEKVFESNDHHFKWDGTFKGKPMMPAVFVYTISARFANDSQSRLYKGSVTLVR